MLEAEMKLLTAALTANTAAILGQAGKPATTAPAKTAAAKKAEAAAKKKEADAAASAEVTPEMAAKVVTEYLKAGDEAQREVARNNVGAIVAHFEADRFTVIEDLALAMDMLVDLQEGRTPEAFAATEDDGGGLV